MSAYLVSKAHIDALVYARSLNRDRYPACGLDARSDDELGRRLWRENMASMAARYPRTDKIDEEALAAYRYDPVAAPIHNGQRLSVVSLLKAIDCYEYQSCEHDGWLESEAHDYCEGLRNKLIGCLPGYDEAPWGID